MARVPSPLQAPTLKVFDDRCYQREDWDVQHAIKAYAEIAPCTQEIPTHADIQIFCLCDGNAQHAKMIKVEVLDSPIQDICSKKANAASQTERRHPGVVHTHENQGCQTQRILVPKQVVMT